MSRNTHSLQSSSGFVKIAHSSVIAVLFLAIFYTALDLLWSGRELAVPAPPTSSESSPAPTGSKRTLEADPPSPVVDPVDELMDLLEKTNAALICRIKTTDPHERARLDEELKELESRRVNVH
jgi:hypothetical protein